MRVITIGGFKGGTGKTTLAALIGVAALKNGLRVAALDLDRNTRNLTNFLTLRRAANLPVPDRVMLMDFDRPNKREPSGRLEPLVRFARMDGYEMMIIDTSSGNQLDVYEAHLLADVILTPMNESPADLHGLFTPLNARSAPQINYRELIDTARFDRKRARMPVQRWHVVRNRVSALPTRIGSIVANRVVNLSAEVGFDGISELRDRVAHRAISLNGRTVLDDPVEGRLTMSEVAGRSEVRAMFGSLLASPPRLAAAA